MKFRDFAHRHWLIAIAYFSPFCWHNFLCVAQFVKQFSGHEECEGDFNQKDANQSCNESSRKCFIDFVIKNMSVVFMDFTDSRGIETIQWLNHGLCR